LRNKIINPITNTKDIFLNFRKNQIRKNRENSNHFANRKEEATRRGS